jgi:hypothetical protein
MTTGASRGYFLTALARRRLPRAARATTESALMSPAAMPGRYALPAPPAPTALPAGACMLRRVEVAALRTSYG